MSPAAYCLSCTVTSHLRRIARLIWERFIDSGGFVKIRSGVLLDNTGATLEIDGTANWILDAGLRLGRCWLPVIFVP